VWALSPVTRTSHDWSLTMNEDIVIRLRHNTCFGIVEPLSAEAADEIKRLRKELAVLRIEQVLKESQELELYE
jgi:hypothetical protein